MQAFSFIALISINWSISDIGSRLPHHLRRANEGTNTLSIEIDVLGAVSTKGTAAVKCNVYKEKRNLRVVR